MERRFISMMRANAARNPTLPAPGKAPLPEQEAFRIGQSAHMTFSPREISHAVMRDGKMDLQLFGLGIWGQWCDAASDDRTGLYPCRVA